MKKTLTQRGREDQDKVEIVKKWREMLLEHVHGGVNLKQAGRDGLRRVLLADVEIVPTSFQILKAHLFD